MSSRHFTIIQPFRRCDVDGLPYHLPYRNACMATPWCRDHDNPLEVHSHDTPQEGQVRWETTGNKRNTETIGHALALQVGKRERNDSPEKNTIVSSDETGEDDATYQPPDVHCYSRPHCYRFVFIEGKGRVKRTDKMQVSTQKLEECTNSEFLWWAHRCIVGILSASDGPRKDKARRFSYLQKEWWHERDGNRNFSGSWEPLAPWG